MNVVGAIGPIERFASRSLVVADTLWRSTSALNGIPPIHGIPILHTVLTAYRLFLAFRLGRLFELAALSSGAFSGVLADGISARKIALFPSRLSLA
jgi:hypothetical protein